MFYSHDDNSDTRNIDYFSIINKKKEEKLTMKSFAFFSCLFPYLLVEQQSKVKNSLK